MTEFTVIIPAYNEEAVIAQVLQDLGKPEGCQEILVIDDGSSDQTAEIARKNGATVIVHRINKGYGAALKTGLRAAKTEVAILYDGDGQHNKQDLMKIAAIAGEHDMVVGVRSKDSHQDWLRMPGKAILRQFVNLMTNTKIPDFNSGLRSFRVPVIRRFLHLMPNGFSFSTTSTVAFYKMQMNVEYTPILVTAREGRKSSVKFLKDGFRVMMLIINITVLFDPLRIFLPMSLFCFLASLLYFVLYSILYRIHITESMVMMFITGVLIFSLGIVCEQISAVRREIKE